MALNYRPKISLSLCDEGVIPGNNLSEYDLYHRRVSEHVKKMAYRFPKSARLLKQVQYDQVFRRRCSLADQYIVLYASSSCEEVTKPRLGLTVSRKCGNAVLRNRWKRTLREAFRLIQHELPPGIDFIVIPRPKATPQVAQLQASLKQLGWRLQRKLRAASQLTQSGKRGPL